MIVLAEKYDKTGLHSRDFGRKWLSFVRVSGNEKALRCSSRGLLAVLSFCQTTPLEWVNNPLK